MSATLVRYTVKEHCANENVRLIAAVFGELEGVKPDGLRYTACRLADSVSFVHLVTVETADGRNPLRALQSFIAFSTTVASRCVAPPVFTTLHTIGAYDST